MEDPKYLIKGITPGGYATKKIEDSRSKFERMSK